MPELPEVETSCRGLRPHLLGQTVEDVRIHQPSLRWPVPKDLPRLLSGKCLSSIQRRGKYLLFDFGSGVMLVHLGMSGSLRLVNPSEPRKKHDHVEWVFGKLVLRLNDPRRFGAVLWAGESPDQHPLLSHLGPEPLSPAFDGDYLYQRSRGRRSAIKSFLMDSSIVVGVGNIYANEALFDAGIRPSRAAGKVSRTRYRLLAAAVCEVLQRAIDSGGSTLRDFVNPEGVPGYFQQTLKVYGRAGEPCIECGEALKEIRLAQRSTVFCPVCQK